MPLHLKLSQKGLIVVSVLLLVELFFLGMLFVLLEQTEREARQYERSNQIIGQANALLKIYYDGGIALTMYATTQMPTYGEKYDEAVKHAPEETQALYDLLKDDPQSLEKAKALVKTFTSANENLNELKKSIDQNSNISVVGLRKRMVPVLTGLLTELKEFTREQEKIASRTDPQSARRMRNEMKWVVLGGVVFNVLVAILLTRFLIGGITRRLEVLTDNTYRLASGEPLKNPVGGGDEIARLDKTFHQMADALEQAARWKRELVAMVSHDLRTPLTSVKGSLTLLSAGATGDLTPQAQEVVIVAENEIERLSHLVNDLLDVAKIEAGKLDLNIRTARVSDIFARSMDAVKMLAEKADVKIEADETDKQVQADPDRIVQVVVNLLSNAIKFTPAGKSVRLSVFELKEQIEIQVIDEGRGVPAELQNAIFERFKQVDKADASEKGGTGLGLAICKAIVEQHGGAIGVRSNQKEGSTFWFRLKT